VPIVKSIYPNILPAFVNYRFGTCVRIQGNNNTGQCRRRLYVIRQVFIRGTTTTNFLLRCRACHRHCFTSADCVALPAMRRSKSNPAKYVKNYRKLSQRRMIHEDEIVAATKLSPDDEMKSVSVPSHPKVGSDNETEPTDMSTLLSSNLLEEFGSDEVVILPSKSKRPRPAAVSDVPLTNAEIKQATIERKKQSRKLQQLAERSTKKERRAQLYAQLQQSAISETAAQLLHSTASWGKTVTHKERVQQLSRRERAGLELSAEERNILYKKPPERRGGTPRQFEDDEDESHDEVHIQLGHSIASSPITRATMPNNDNDDAGQTVKRPTSQQESPVSCKRQRQVVNDLETNSICERDKKPDSTVPSPSDQRHPASPQSSSQTSASGHFLATQMLASLASLQKKIPTPVAAVVQETPSPDTHRPTSSQCILPPKIKPYIPTEPIQIQTTQSYAKQEPNTSPKESSDATSLIRCIQRPADVTATRVDLPVAAMEFDIMDAVRNHDVTIVCAATGSGKSTQVPQFLYEAGESLSPRTAITKDGATLATKPLTSYLIGVTQPRRVAAVSTAKRVCYELGFGPGSSISSNNVVAYQTRHETAGLGSNTRIKFMTDGILLQEIQSDLLLRKYSAIVLDEAHERNLNTDVLLGLLSVALPLRREASLQDSTLVPLKVVIMSATLRVQDFTQNPRLFATLPVTTTVVTVPGRTYPVTIHHSKVTELDDYGT
jgi:ATP-dependent RNA helicase DHX37/DHR1